MQRDLDNPDETPVDQLMEGDRHLDWPGCFNVRDLGGLPTKDGRTTRRGRVVRADGLDRLTDEGWSALVAHGIRTVVDLRNDDEVAEDVDSSPRPAHLATIRVPLDDIEDKELWRRIRDEELDGSPLYFPLFLERKPERCAAAVRAIARTGEEGVVFHCGAGRDRTGLITLLVLGAVGVTHEAIADDYELSTARLRARFEAMGWEDQGTEIAGILKRKSVTARELLLDLLGSFDPKAYLLSAGLSREELDALERRLLGAPV